MPKNLFGFSTALGDGIFALIVKYDARAGRIFRVDRTQDSSGNFVNESVDITQPFKAIFDFKTMQAGWFLFAAGSAPDLNLVDIGQEFPARPSANHKHGVKLMIKLAKDCGGDKPIREMAGTSKAFLSGVEPVYAQYLAEKDNHPGKLPVIVLERTTLVTTGSGDKRSTNYHPVFKIIGWAAWGDPGGVSVPPTGSPPATGSTQVEAPKADETVSADDFG
jgi:hypothetical protein